jgi:8-oxo-dGTP pyrophosphatase MutT (NUDIX family)
MYTSEIGVGIAIIVNAKFLLTKRRDYPAWCIPGGNLSPGESVIDAAVREAWEETGLIVQVTNFVGFYSLLHKWENGSCEIILQGEK